jgi:RimJ/RimL family protein N-acetyltransferase
MTSEPETADVFAPLKGRHSELRPVTEADYGFLFQLSMDEEIAYRGRFRGETPSPEAFVRAIWNNVFAQFIVYSSRSAEPNGHVFAYNLNQRDRYAFLGIVVAPWAIGKGWALEAAGLFVNYLFVNWDLRKLYGESIDFNYKSFRSGVGSLFEEEGILRKHYFYNGRYWDTHMLALNRSDWERRFVQRASSSRITPVAGATP